MRQLRDLQRAFQARVLSLEPGIEPELKDSRAADFASRLEAYVGGYRTRLVEALGTTYPVLKTTLGEEEFDRQIRLYIDSTPSRHYSVRQYGADIAEWMAARHPDDGGSLLAELARWEWTLADVFDAPDDDAVGVAALASLPPPAWPGLSFALRASIRRVETRSNVVEWWRAANGVCAKPAALAAAAPTEWLLWRSGIKTLFRSLDTVEADLLDQAGAGLSFGEICERLAERSRDADPALRAASLLRGWIADELIATHFQPDAHE